MNQYIQEYERYARKQSEMSERVMTPGLYCAEEPLANLVQRLSHPHTRINATDYINLATKYTIAYIFKNEKEDPVSELLMRYFFTLAGKIANTKYSKFNDDLEENIALSGYQLSMVGDIAGTVSILKDIIEREIYPESSGVYTGIDLGSGTGILLLAQYLQAKRNGFQDIRLHGIEFSPTAAREANRLARSLSIGEVHLGSSTEREVFNQNCLNDKELTFISSENLPRPGNSFFSADAFGLHREPQFANVQNLRHCYSAKILEKAEYFPHILKCGNTKNSTIIQGSGKEGYGIETAMSIEAKNHGDTPIDEDALFYPKTIYPIGISRGTREEDIVLLGDIGTEFRRGSRKNPSGNGVFQINGLARW